MVSIEYIYASVNALTDTKDVKLRRYHGISSRYIILHVFWNYTSAQQQLRWATLPERSVRKVGAAVPISVGGGAGSSFNTTWPGPKPTSVPNGILIHPTVWPQYTNVTDRQDGQRSGSIGQTVLQTVAKNELNYMSVIR